MKLFAAKEHLLQGVNTVQRAVSSKSPLPILSGILLTTKDNLLKFTATDLEMGIECTVPVTVEKPGSVVVPARYFSEVVRRLPDSRIEIETNLESQQITLRYGQSEITINGFSAEDFPVLPQIDGDNSITINASALRNMVKKVAFATSSETSRPIFTGVLLEIHGEELIMVATDTHRLAFNKGKAAVAAGTRDLSVIIPSRTVNEISKITGDDTQIRLSFSENQVLFEADNVCLISRLISGQFPNYSQVIPQGFATQVRVKTKDFLESVERAALLTKEGSNVIKISIEEMNMTLTSNSPEVGRIFEQLPIFAEGEKTEISFNSRYLQDVLKVSDEEEICLELSGALSPGIIKPTDNQNYIYLILPIRTL